jgi:hypothetical protein
VRHCRTKERTPGTELSRPAAAARARTAFEPEMRISLSLTLTSRTMSRA